MGKAFEYACLNAIFEHLKNEQNIEIENSSALHVAADYYKTVEKLKVAKMSLAADAAARAIVRLEPQLKYPNGNSPLYLSIQEDARGRLGDVRDVLCIRKQNGWEIGISCKHNHFAVKHSRLSQTIDFGAQWFQRPCSEEYFSDIATLFNELSGLKSGGVLWRNINNKAERFYIPLLDAFSRELRRLDSAYAGEIASALIAYFLGRKDFYKIIAKDNNSTTLVQAYNFGSLNRPSGAAKPQYKVPILKLPSKIYNISYKPRSNNTIIVTCDGGWAVSLRIHSASLVVEPSLKFDINLVGTPDLGSRIEEWGISD